MNRQRAWSLVVAVAAIAAACGSAVSGGADAADAADAAETTDGATDADAGADADATADGDATAIPDGAEVALTRQPDCEGGVGSGTRRRWTDPLTGYVYCEATCASCTAVCENDGTATEGWYSRCTVATVDAGCGDAPFLIVAANCM